MALANAIQTEYKIPASVTVNNGSHLRIMFQNAPLEAMKLDSAHHSVRRATAGSTFAARSAGTRLATTPAANNPALVAMSMKGSVG